MAVLIRNLTSGPIYVPLNNGTHVRVSPKAVAKGVPDHEVQRNAKVEKLLRLHAIVVEPMPASKGAASEPGGEGEAADSGSTAIRARKKN